MRGFATGAPPTPSTPRARSLVKARGAAFNEMGTAMRSFLDFIARLFGNANAITKGCDEQRVAQRAERDANTEAEDDAWAEQRVEEAIAEADKLTLLEFPGFSSLWSFGTEYRDAESKWHYGPPGWYGIANEFGGSPLPDGGFGSGMHKVGPESDPTSALLAIMRYVQDLEAEREREDLDAEKEAFGPSGTR